MKWIVFLMLIVAVGLCASAAMAWVDSFESYPWQNWETITAPWESAINLYVQPGWGYPDTTLAMGACGPTQAWSWGTAFRPTGTTADATLRGKMYIDPDPVFSWNQAWFGLTTDTTIGESYEFLGGSSAYFDIINHGTLGPQLRFWVQSGGSADLVNIPVTVGDWYDVKLDVTGLNVDAYYKLSSAANWTTMGTLQAYAGFVPNYVAMSAHHGAYLDNVQYSASGTVGALAGSVNLQGFSGDLSLATIRVEAMQMGTIMKTAQVRVTQNPMPYSIQDLDVGAYDVRFSALQWLSKVQEGVSVGAGTTTTASESLSICDVDGDNEVTSTDASVVLRNLN